MLHEILTTAIAIQVHDVFSSVFMHEKDPATALEITKDIATSNVRKELENELLSVLLSFELSEQQLDVLVFNAKERLGI